GGLLVPLPERKHVREGAFVGAAGIPREIAQEVAPRLLGLDEKGGVVRSPGEDVNAGAGGEVWRCLEGDGAAAAPPQPPPGGNLDPIVEIRFVAAAEHRSPSASDLGPGAAIVVEGVDLHPALVDVDAAHLRPVVDDLLYEVGEGGLLDALRLLEAASVVAI